MSGAIFRDTLRDNWKQMLGWGAGMGGMGFYIVAMMQDSAIMEQYSELLGSLPPAMLQIFGAGNTAMFQSMEGYLNAFYVTYAMLMLSVFAVSAGMSITMNEEDEGILDVFMALPVSRQSIIIEKYLALTLISAGIVALCIALPVIGLVMFGVETDLGKVVLSILTIYPGLLLIIAISGLIAVIVRRKVTAIGLAAGFIVASYFLNFIGESATESFAEQLRGLSLFYYTNGQSIVLDAFNPLGLVALIVVSCLIVLVTVQAFQRRDIGL